MKRQNSLYPLPIVILIYVFITSLSTSTSAQTIYFHEDFETSPVTSLVNKSSGTLPDGASTCGRASRGNTTDFNSSHVDFNSVENSTYFLGVNPESPCGGYYTAVVSSDTFDLSTAADTLYFKCRYFIGSNLGWGLTGITITFGNGSTTYNLDTIFTVLDNWTNLEVPLPASMKSSKVSMQITISAGDGVGLDDITVQDGRTVSCTNTTSTIDTTICDSYTSPSGKYTWSANGTYHDTIPNSGGCDSVITINLQKVYLNNLVSMNGGVLISADSNATYQWLDCDKGYSQITGETNQQYTPNSGGDFAVEISSMGCTDTSSCYGILGPDAIEEYKAESIGVYPNPVTDAVYLEIPGNEEKNLAVFNSLGQRVYSIKTAKQKIRIPFDEPPGVYWVKIRFKSGNIVIREIIKQ